MDEQYDGMNHDDDAFYGTGASSGADDGRSVNFAERADIPDNKSHDTHDTDSTDDREKILLSDELPDEADEEELSFINSNNSAAKVNVGAIFAVIFIILAVIILVIMVLTKLSSSEKEKENNMLSSGGRSVPNVAAMIGRKDSSVSSGPFVTDSDEDIQESGELTDEDIDDILNGLPDDYKLPGKSTSSGGNIFKQEEPGTAPIRQQKEETASKPSSQDGGSSPAPQQNNNKPQNEPAPTAPKDNPAPTPVVTNPVPEKTSNPVEDLIAAVTPSTVTEDPLKKPDTRRSNSVRKIEGLGGVSGTPSGQGSQTLGDFSIPDPSQMSRDEYIKQMAALQGSQTSGASSGGGSSSDSVEQAKQDFFNSSGTAGAGTGYYLARNTIWDGTIIKGALETGINTDNPGVVIARVTENVYSSYDFSYLLIPEGTLLYATYNSSVSYGQDRIQIAWNLLIRPDGYRMDLGNMNGVDSEGYSGLEGWKYNHIWEEMKALGMVALYSILNTEVTNDIAKEKNEFISNAMTDVYQSTQRVLNGIVERALDIKPSITVSPGTEIKLITNQPLTLPAMEPFPVTQKYVRY